MDEECSVDVLKLDHYPPEDFDVCVCQTEDDSTSIFYFIFFHLWDFYVTTMLIWNFVLELRKEDLKSFAFLEFWTLFLFLSSSLWLQYNGRIFKDLWSDYGYMDSLPWYKKIHWAFYSALLPATFLSCAVFWILIYKKDKSAIFFMVLNSATPAIVLLSFLLIAFPLRLLNFFYFIIFYTVYILFTVIYQKCGGTGTHGSVAIYEVLDWRHPGKAALAAVIGLVIGEAIYILFCFLSMGKLWLRKRYIY